MLKEIYEIDERGFLKETYVGKFDENGELQEIVGGFEVEDLVFESSPKPLTFIKPKWNGEEWVEGETEEEKAEREALDRLAALQPTAEQLTNADFEIKILTLLQELEVI